MAQEEQQQQRNPSCTDGQAPCIEGAWVLDLSRSETMEGYLRLSGVPAEGIKAHVMAERRHGGLNLIQVEEGKIAIHKETYATNCTETFDIGKEKFTHDIHNGVWKSSFLSVTTPGPSGYVQSARGTLFLGGNEAHVLETRYVTGGGLSHVQIQLRNLVTGEESMTTRIWRRVSMTHEHRAILALLAVGHTARE